MVALDNVCTASRVCNPGLLSDVRADPDLSTVTADGSAEIRATHSGHLRDFFRIGIVPDGGINIMSQDEVENIYRVDYEQGVS